MNSQKHIFPILAMALAVLMTSGVLAYESDSNPEVHSAVAQTDLALSESSDVGLTVQNESSPDDISSPDAVCDGGSAPAVERISLTDCYQRNFTVGGNARKIRVLEMKETSCCKVQIMASLTPSRYMARARTALAVRMPIRWK